MGASMAIDENTTAQHSVSLGEAFWVWTRVAALSFGGPAGQIAVMHKILVEEKRWIGENRFLHALNYCMLLPGPEAQQLATYIGWLMHGPRGGLIAGGLFIVPGIVSIMALSYLYAACGNTGLIAALFFGLKVAVLAIVTQAVLRVAKRALKNQAMIAIAVASFVGIFFFAVPFPIIVITAGLVGYLGRRAELKWFDVAIVHGPSAAPHADTRPSLIDDTDGAHAQPDTSKTLTIAAIWLALWLIPVIGLYVILGPANVYTQIALFFSKMALVTFGGAYAVLAYVAQEAVSTYHWVSPGEMLDGLGMAETTPGPLIMVLQFIGFMAAYRAPGTLPPIMAATLGGLLATWVTFAPCFVWIFAGAPFIERLRGNKALASILSAITAAVVGVIANLSLWFAIHTLFAKVTPIRAYGLAFDLPVWSSLDAPALALSLAALFAVFRLNLSMPLVLAGCALAGVILKGVVGL